jgi:hypothetical protein
MAAITATSLLTILKAGSYPYSVRFRTTEPKFPIYPYVIVRKAKPQGSDEDYVTITKRDGFEITLFVRYTRTPDQEEKDQTAVEEEILSLLETTDFGATHLFSESKTWQRRPLQRMYGSQSVITVNITDIVSKSGDGVIGAESKIELNSDGTPTQIQVLRLSDNRGTQVDAHLNDAGQSFWDPTSSEAHSLDFTYESTIALDTIINTAADSKDEIKGKLVRGGVTSKYLFLIGKTIKSGQFDNIERATTTLYVSGTWA